MDIAKSYSQVAVDYAEKIFHELDGKPKDREILDRFAQMVGKDASVCDLGCGPGQVARYLKSKDLKSFGIDISPGMIERASLLNPDLEFQVGDMRALPLPDNALDGVAAFYSLIHIGKKDLPRVFLEIKRVLRPEGLLLFSFHIGDQTIHLDDWWGHKVNLDFHFFESAEIRPLVLNSGLKIIDVIEREPYDEKIEHQSRRAYFLAKKGT